MLCTLTHWLVAELYYFPLSPSLTLFLAVSLFSVRNNNNRLMLWQPLPSCRIWLVLIYDSIVVTVNQPEGFWLTTRILSSKLSGSTTHIFFPMPSYSNYRKVFERRYGWKFWCDEIRALLVASPVYDNFVLHYSEQRSNGRTEEAIMLNWAEYVNECASGMYIYY